MKNRLFLYLLILLAFFLIIKIGQCQKADIALYNFETNNINYEVDTLFIDSIANCNNIWQIGQPNKLIFQSAYSLPNAIVTKLDTVYPINDTSSFIIVHEADMALNDWGVLFLQAMYKINTDTITDFGSIEFSPNNGNTWINLLTDTIYSQQNLYDWSSNDKPVFSGNSAGWQILSLCITDYDHYFNISDGDTVLFRFTFISDSIQTFKAGWMLDDIRIDDWYENVQENIPKNMLIHVYPNPFTLQTNIQNGNAFENAIFQIYNTYGQQVKQINNVSGKTFIFGRDNLPNGIYLLRIKQKNRVVATKKIIIN